MVNNRILFLGWYKTLDDSMARTSFFHIFVYINKFTYITHKSNFHENHIQQVRMHAVLLVWSYETYDHKIVDKAPWYSTVSSCTHFVTL